MQTGIYGKKYASHTHTFILLTFFLIVGAEHLERSFVVMLYTFKIIDHVVHSISFIHSISTIETLYRCDGPHINRWLA